MRPLAPARTNIPRNIPPIVSLTLYATSLLPTTPSHRRWFILAAKIAVFVLVCWGIIRSLGKARLELQNENFVWGDVGWPWFAVAGLAYALSMIPMAWFWQQLLISMDQRVGGYETFRAYTIGHLSLIHI